MNTKSITIWRQIQCSPWKAIYVFIRHQILIPTCADYCILWTIGCFVSGITKGSLFHERCRRKYRVHWYYRRDKNPANVSFMFAVIYRSLVCTHLWYLYCVLCISCSQTNASIDSQTKRFSISCTTKSQLTLRLANNGCRPRKYHCNQRICFI